MEKIKVVLADDHQLMRQTMADTLRLTPDIEVLGEANNGLELIELCRTHKPDVAIVDIRMPVMDGVEATALLKKEFPNMKVLMLTVFDDTEYLRKLFALGINGYLLKSSRHIALSSAVRSVYEGISAMDGSIIIKAGTLIGAQISNDKLTFTEEKVAELIIAGKYNKEIASELDISYGRVRNIVSGIYTKLGVFGREGVLEKLREQQNKD